MSSKSISSGLNSMFGAKGIAIIGASARAGKPGNQIVKFAKAMEYDGQIFPINPARDEIEGLKCYRNLLDVPGRVDLVVVVVGAEEAARVGQEIAARRDAKGDVAGAVVVSGGFSESGSPEGIEREKTLLEPLQARGIRVIGPNCQGIIDEYTGVNTTFDVPPYPRGGVSIVAQSGAFACSFLMWAYNLELMGLSKFFSLGAFCVVDVFLPAG